MSPVSIRATVTDPNQWTVPALLELRAADTPEAPFLQWVGAPPLSYAHVAGRVARLAGGLAAAGVEPGAPVLLLMRNALDYLFAWFALNSLGAVEVPVNTEYRGSYLEHVANDSTARLMIADAEFLPAIADVAGGLTCLDRVIVRGTSAPQADTSRFSRMAWSDVESGAPLSEWPRVAPGDLAAIIYTSGTTGRSKGVAMTHSHVYAFGEEGATLVRLTTADRYYNPFPMFHANSQILTVIACLIRGGCAVLDARFSASEWARIIREESVTVTNLIGATSTFIYSTPPHSDDADNRLRVVEFAPTPHAIAAEFQARFGIEEMVESFGQTETGLTILCPYGQPRPRGTVGQVLADWFEVRLADPVTGADVPVGEMGELLVRPRRGGLITRGYFGNAEASVKAMHDLWWHTGDGLRQDADGWFYFVDRVNDAIRVRGENVSSDEVEAAVRRHPAVLDCAAIAVPSELAGGEHEIKICVVIAEGAEGAEIDAPGLREFCVAHMPKFAVPRYIEFVPELPVTSSNKVRKVALRADARNNRTWDALAPTATGGQVALWN